MAKKNFQMFSLSHDIGFRNLYPNKPDTSDPHTVITGFVKRLMCDVHPRLNKRMLKDFRSFVRGKLKQWYLPIQAETDTTVETWLSKTNYSEVDKEHMKQTWNKTKHLYPNMKVNDATWKKHFYVKAFPKEEPFPVEETSDITRPKLKDSRMIYARIDDAKVYFGPYAKLMEEQIFYTSNPNNPIKFAKSIEPTLFKKELDEFQDYPNFIQTDYSSFEGSFSPKLMKACEVQMYKYMLSNYPNVRDTFIRLSRTNHIRSKFCTATIEGCRMSGDMVTSLSNGFTNMMVQLFLAHHYKYPLRKGLVEGDDGLFAYASSSVPKIEEYAQLGFIIKTETKRSVWDTSFCSKIYNNSGTLTYPPLDFLRNFNWSENPRAKSGKVTKRLELLSLKALSYLVQFPNCPVIAPIAFALLDKFQISFDERRLNKLINTDRSIRNWLSRKSLSIRDLMSYKEHLFHKPTISYEDRLKYSTNYNFPIHMQLYAEENYFKNLNWPYEHVSCSGFVLETNLNQPYLEGPTRVNTSSLIYQHVGFNYSQVMGSGTEIAPARHIGIGL